MTMSMAPAQRSVGSSRRLTQVRDWTPTPRDHFPSPADWRNEVLYFLLPDRFSDGREDQRQLATPDAVPSMRPSSWSWEHWAQSGALRYQGGNLAGIESKLPYLAGLGITALWVAPVFKQRANTDDYHGYAIQDFLEVDPHFGTQNDLIKLVQAAHQFGIRVILDIVVNHSGVNWLYAPDVPGGPVRPDYVSPPQQLPFGAWLDRAERPTTRISDPNDGVWPVEFQDQNAYTRAGSADPGKGATDDPLAEFRRGDLMNSRDLDVMRDDVLSPLVRVWQYWIDTTDCDGFRIDTLKHLPYDAARRFCGAIKEFADSIGKHNFFIVGEMAGGDLVASRYLELLGANLDAALDINDARSALHRVARGAAPALEYFQMFAAGADPMGSHREHGNRHVSVLDDHDNVGVPKIRFAAEAPSPDQVVAAIAIVALTLGIPCIYYGTEQALSGPEREVRRWLPSWNNDRAPYADRYLREAMFGPQHPRKAGQAGLAGEAGIDTDLPGFGAYGTSGLHCFNVDSPVYEKIREILAIRKQYAALRYGRQYLRQTSLFDRPFSYPEAGELTAWSRILADSEVVCVVNTHPLDARGADIVVDSALHPPGSTLTPAFSFSDYQSIRVQGRSDGTAFIPVRNVPRSGVLILT
ncbi:alpha-amylase family glycosyl hydrolase [Mycobacterium attenuatum]|uniref:alpha-amylase family glycosyl hydrolase n=1 Tax=Mycobacterium attenuatum TaxID=2341086 RepID=UPI001B7D4B57|nr:alpha-amylase family glycosyl hydrolase [Mycobacterium attenuatum]